MFYDLHLSREEQALITENKVFKYVEEFHRKRGMSPSMAEIATGLQISKSTVHKYLLILQDKEKLTLEAKRARSIRIKQHTLEKNVLTS